MRWGAAARLAWMQPSLPPCVPSTKRRLPALCYRRFLARAVAALEAELEVATGSVASGGSGADAAAAAMAQSATDLSIHLGRIERGLTHPRRRPPLRSVAVVQPAPPSPSG